MFPAQRHQAPTHLGGSRYFRYAATGDVRHTLGRQQEPQRGDAATAGKPDTKECRKQTIGAASGRGENPHAKFE